MTPGVEQADSIEAVKAKAIKRFQMRNMVDRSSRRDIKENYAYDQEQLKIEQKFTLHLVLTALHVGLTSRDQGGACSRPFGTTSNELGRLRKPGGGRSICDVTL